MFQPRALRFCAILLVLGMPTALPRAQSRIEEARFVQLGGIDQWITVRGQNRDSPVLLILHGGPGETQSPLVSTYEPLEEDFVVVQWDQRGAGKTLAHAGASTQMTSLELLVRDGIELTEYTRKYLHTDNVILVGHSWGSFLGVHIVKRQPVLFRAFVGTGQVVGWRGMVEAQYRYTLDRARAESDTTVVTELESLGIPAPDNFDQYLVMRRRLNRYLALSDLQWLTNQDALVRRALSPDDLRAYRQGFQAMTGLASTVFSMDLPSLGFDFKVPFFLIQGSDDHITPAPLAAIYFEQITTTTKRMTLIDGAGHFAPMTHMQQFVAALRDDLRVLSR
jgi:pimeloyl-ACP methyl ester carboxylesterase